MIIHTVMPGDTLYTISRRYGVEMERLIADNGLDNPDRLVVGQTLVILFPQMVHTVQEGESLFTIARAYGLTLNQLYRNNPGLMGTPLIPGQQVVIRYLQERLGSMDVNGYAYPFIDQTLLRSTLPYLTYLMPFTYEITDEGALVPPDDDKLIAMAREFSVTPLMNLSNLREPKGFDSALAHQVLNDEAVQERVIGETVETIRRKRYGGLDVDFEYVPPEDKYRLAEFIQRLRDNLNPMGREVFAALAAKASGDQPGILVEGHDYRAVGAAADGVLLMTYEWGYRYGPPMAVAPIGNVRQVLDYAVTEMPPGKIFLGVPNYGYDWPLPFRQGETAARSLSNVEAVALAADTGAEIRYDSASQAPYFHYTRDGTAHVVWFDDAKSIRAKLELAAEYGLRGAGYWNLMRPFPENWSVLNALYRVNQ